MSKSLALAERTHLHFHLLFLLSFNTLMQEARAAHSSNLVSKSRDNPKVLFDMVSDIVTSAPPVISIFFKEDQENVSSFFVEKKSNVSKNIFFLLG